MTIASLIEKYRGIGTGITHLTIADSDQVITEWYCGDRHRNIPHMLHSATKSLVGTAAGMAIAEGVLDLDAPMLDYLPKSAGQPRDPRASEITIKNLLSMRTGHGSGSSGLLWRTLNSSWIAEYLSEPLVTQPGKDFIYSSGTSHMLAVCVQRATGERLDNYLRPRLFEPLGFSGVEWSTDPEGFCSGGNGLTVRTVDLLRWGVLHLRKGEWNGLELIPTSWIDEATTRQVDASHSAWNGSGYTSGIVSGDEAEGYGYQLWLKNGAYYASGMFGQCCLVVPDAGKVIAVNSALNRPQARALVADLIDFARSDLDGADVRQVGARRVPLADEPAELCARLIGEYVGNDGSSARISLRYDDSNSGQILALDGHDAAGDLRVLAGIGTSRCGTGPMPGPRLHHSYSENSVPIAARADQIGSSTMAITIDYLSTPFIDTLLLSPNPHGGVTLTRSSNVNSTSTPPIETALIVR
ncbi:serine hydrolase domain-containing protein [Brevibacterium sp. FME17]|uniref:serine hydrolase domain-containing protein n=1 Tax=Brevibacterium sp. FME17 TaxID=2742606 RepID=UPI001868F665|nr:serine hydrolase [Brevibacterium sp. FME17]